MATIAPAAARGRERRFFAGMALVMLATVIIGFAPSYYLRGFVTPYAPILPMTPLVHVHGLLFSTWLLLFVAQTQFVAAGRTDIHRKLGIAGFVLLPAMIVVGTLAALHGALRASGPPIIPPMSFLAVPLFDIISFPVLIGTALMLRSQPQTHKRLMYIAMTGMMAPAVGRLPMPAFLQNPVGIFGPSDMFLVPLLAYDLIARGRLHPATIWGSLFLVGTQVFRLAIMGSEPWLAFARWATGLVG